MDHPGDHADLEFHAFFISVYILATGVQIGQTKTDTTSTDNFARHGENLMVLWLSILHPDTENQRVNKFWHFPRDQLLTNHDDIQMNFGRRAEDTN